MSDVIRGLRTAGNTIPAERNPSGLPSRRRWGRLAAGIVAVGASVWITVSLVGSAGERTGVLVVANDVAAFDTIDRADLHVAGASLDSGIRWIPAEDVDQVVGQVAAAQLTAGELLSSDQLVPEGDQVVGEGEVVVGTRLSAGELPADVVQPGVAIVAVVRSGQGSDDVAQVEGWVLHVGDVDPATGDRLVSLVVPSSAAATLSAAAAEERVSLVALRS